MKTATHRAYVSPLSLSPEDLGKIAKGWSIKKEVLGKDVYNTNDDNIGTIEDLLVSRDKSISYAIIGVGGFLGLGRHDVAIPVHQLRKSGTRIMLPGATAESLKGLPVFAGE